VSGQATGRPDGELLRLFVGLRVSPAARAALAREGARLARDDDALRVTREPDLHLTLQFLGDTPRERVDALGQALGEVARAHAPFDVRYAGLGTFPERGEPSVVWVGVSEQKPGGLAALARAVGEALTPLGFAREARAFAAHVTLARVRRGARLAPATLERIARGREADFGPDRLSDLKLIVSLVGQVGYAYKDLTSHPLAGAPP